MSGCRVKHFVRQEQEVINLFHSILFIIFEQNSKLVKTEINVVTELRAGDIRNLFSDLLVGG